MPKELLQFPQYYEYNHIYDKNQSDGTYNTKTGHRNNTFIHNMINNCCDIDNMNEPDNINNPNNTDKPFFLFATGSSLYFNKESQDDKDFLSKYVDVRNAFT